MCSKREGSEALYGRNQLGVGPYSVAVHAAQPAGPPRARTTVSTIGRTHGHEVDEAGRGEKRLLNRDLSQAVGPSQV